MYDCIIIGGGPAGLTAAIYLKRAGYKIKVIAGSDLGGNLNKISCIENYPGIIGLSGKDLAANMIKQCTDLNIEFDLFNNAETIENNIVTLNNKSQEYAKTFIIACGSIPNITNMEFEKNYLKYISFCATCDGPFYKNKTVAVYGGGNSAMEFCIALSKYCDSIYLIHRRDKFRADKTMTDKVLALNKVSIFYNSNIIDIIGNNNIEKIIIKNNISQLINELNVNGLFYALGYKQNKIIIKNTNNIFYAGDCFDTKYRQVITACGDGCKAAIDAMEKLQ